MTRDAFEKLLPLAVPAHVADCPICTAPIVIDALDEWLEPVQGGDIGLVDECDPSITCSTEPEIEDPEWSDWMRGHFSTPYIDWLPVTKIVGRWLNTEVLRVKEPR